MTFKTDNPNIKVLLIVDNDKNKDKNFIITVEEDSVNPRIYINNTQEYFYIFECENPKTIELITNIVNDSSLYKQDKNTILYNVLELYYKFYKEKVSIELIDIKIYNNETIVNRLDERCVGIEIRRQCNINGIINTKLINENIVRMLNIDTSIQQHLEKLHEIHLSIPYTVRFAASII